MIDKVWLIQHSYDTSGGPASNESRKAYSLAERWETHAQILMTTLTSDKVSDDAMSDLSTFAPLKREINLRPEEEDDKAGGRKKKRHTRKGGRPAAVQRQDSKAVGDRKSIRRSDTFHTTEVPREPNVKNKGKAKSFGSDADKAG